MTGMSIPRDLLEVTPSWLTAALRDSGAAGSPAVTGYSADAIAEGKGFMSQLYRLRLDYDADAGGLPRTVILKLPSSDPLMRTFFDRLRQNLREVLFYQQAVSAGYLETPRSYFSGTDPATGNTALLLEDMSDARQGDSVAGCTLAEAQLAIVQLARFHASWWDSPRLDALDWLPPKVTEASVYKEIYADSWQSFIGKAGEGMPRGLRDLGDRLGDEISAIKARLSRTPQTLLHGDYRLDNCFFPTAEGSPPLVVFDWEFCVRGRGAYDVAAFISEAYSAEQRRDEEMGLLRTYHETLLENGVSGYSFEECVEDYRLSMMEVAVFWIVTGGYCEYDGERATTYLHNSLARFDAAIADLACAELLAR